MRSVKHLLIRFGNLISVFFFSFNLDLIPSYSLINLQLRKKQNTLIQLAVTFTGVGCSEAQANGHKVFSDLFWLRLDECIQCYHKFKYFKNILKIYHFRLCQVPTSKRQHDRQTDAVINPNVTLVM